MTTFFVDVDALQQLASNLELIYNALDHASDNFNAFDDVIGSSDVHGALDDFVGGWKDGRKTIKDEIKKYSTNAGINTTTRSR